MTSDDRTEWPSSRKLEELRSEGVVPYSSVGGLLVVCAALGVGVWAFEDRIAAWWSAWQGVIAAGGEPGAAALSGEKLVNDLQSLLLVAVVPVLCATVFVLVAGFLQTKFMIRLSAVGFDAARIFELRNLRDVVPRGVRALCVAAAVLGGGLLGAALAAPLAISLLRLDSHAVSLLPELGLRVAAFVVGPVGVSAAVIAIVLNQLEFRRTHRMTRAEAEEEKRDGG